MRIKTTDLSESQIKYILENDIFINSKYRQYKDIHLTTKYRVCKYFLEGYRPCEIAATGISLVKIRYHRERLFTYLKINSYKSIIKAWKGMYFRKGGQRRENNQSKIMIDCNKPIDDILTQIYTHSLSLNGGNVTRTCKVMKTSRRRVYRHVNKSKEEIASMRTKSLPIQGGNTNKDSLILPKGVFT